VNQTGAQTSGAPYSDSPSTPNSRLVRKNLTEPNALAYFTVATTAMKKIILFGVQLLSFGFLISDAAVAGKRHCCDVTPLYRISCRKHSNSSAYLEQFETLISRVVFTKLLKIILQSFSMQRCCGKDTTCRRTKCHRNRLDKNSLWPWDSDH
jgi:hypothetical protein